MILYSIFFGIWLYVAFRKQGLTPFTLLLIEYFVGAIASLILYYYYNDLEQISSVSNIAIIYHIIIYFICFAPLQKFFNINILRIKPIKEEYWIYFSFVLIVINIPSLIYSLSSLNNILTQYDFNLGAVRNGVYGQEISLYEGRFAFERLAAATSIFSLIPFFHFLKFKGHRTLKVLLFLSSLEIVVDNLKGMSRDGVLIWLFCLVGLFLIYRKSFSTKIKKSFKIIYLIIILFVAAFISITLSRASSMIGGDYSDPLYFFVSYLGKSFVRFQEMFSIEVLHYPGSYSTTTFMSFVSSFLISYGPWITFFIAILFSLLIRNFMKGNSFFDLSVFIVLYYFFSFGLLYRHYYFSNSGTIYSITIILILSWLLTFLSDKRNHYINNY